MDCKVSVAQNWLRPGARQEAAIESGHQIILNDLEVIIQQDKFQYFVTYWQVSYP